LELSVDDVKAGQRVLLIDDLIATGGTAIAAINLLHRCNVTIVGVSFVVGLPELGGIEKIETLGLSVHCLLEYKGH